MRRHLVAVRHLVSTAPQRSEHEAFGPGSPVGTVLGLFAAFIVLSCGLAVTSNDERSVLPLDVAADVGLVATTLYVLASFTVAYRALRTRARGFLPVAVTLLVSGAWWSLCYFVADGQPGRFVSVALCVLAATVGVVLVLESRERARWLGTFCALGTLGTFAVIVISLSTAHTDAAPTLSLAATMAAMACLYGSLVEIETAERRSMNQLAAAKQQIESEISQTEDLLHDLRSGLLSIEAAMGAFDPNVVGPLKTEAARLRRLTARDRRQLSDFDVVTALHRLVSARHSAGVDIDLRAPTMAMAFGEESEVAAIVDNLVANAHRHGRGPAVVEIVETTGGVAIMVSDNGSASAIDADRIFERGFTSNPDGEGLGLARARMLAQANAGELIFDPLDDGRTRFTLRLPAGRSSDQPDGRPNLHLVTGNP